MSLVTAAVEACERFLGLTPSNVSPAPVASRIEPVEPRRPTPAPSAQPPIRAVDLSPRPPRLGTAQERIADTLAFLNALRRTVPDGSDSAAWIDDASACLGGASSLEEDRRRWQQIREEQGW